MMRRSSDLIDSASRATNHGAELTGKLLTFARRQRLVPQPIEPRSRLEEISHLLQRTLGETIRLSVECPEGLPRARADPTQFDTALINLALNARDAMPYGGAITMQAEERWIEDFDAALKPGRYLVFSVIDTGQGMTEEVQRRAIEPFFTTKSAGRGSGLGLSMVYGFAEQSGGALRIESRLGYGARVELSLPLAGSAEPVAQAQAVESIAGDGETLLVVEDDDEVRRIAVSFLGALGYRTLAVGNAAEALAEPAVATGYRAAFHGCATRCGHGRDRTGKAGTIAQAGGRHPADLRLRGRRTSARTHERTIRNPPETVPARATGVRDCAKPQAANVASEALLTPGPTLSSVANPSRSTIPIS